MNKNEQPFIKNSIYLKYTKILWYNLYHVTISALHKESIDIHSNVTRETMNILQYIILKVIYIRSEMRQYELCIFKTACSCSSCHVSSLGIKM